MDRNTIMIIALAVMILFIGYQSVQISGLSSQSTVAGGASATNSPQASGQNEVVTPKSLQSLPGMVGGC